VLARPLERSVDSIFIIEHEQGVHRAGIYSASPETCASKGLYLEAPRTRAWCRAVQTLDQDSMGQVDGEGCRTLGALSNDTDRCHPHMLRHSGGYKLANDGRERWSPQEYLGHKNIQHTAMRGSRTSGETDHCCRRRDRLLLRTHTPHPLVGTMPSRVDAAFGGRSDSRHHPRYGDRDRRADGDACDDSGTSPVQERSPAQIARHAELPAP
jgi:hypothetical protein